MGDNGDWRNQLMEFGRRKRIAKSENRRCFLRRCIEEQVLPSSAPRQLRDTHHPFPPSAREYLHEGKHDLQGQLILAQECLEGVDLSTRLKARLQLFSQKHRQSLHTKLSQLCRRSRWTRVGRRELLTNISSTNLTEEETQALSLGLKFDTGRDRRPAIDYFVANHHSDSDVERGFIQGLVAATTSLSKVQQPSLPLRFVKALERLGRNNNLHITKADKGGGVIVMDSSEYTQKMTSLLADCDTYQPMPVGSGLKEATVLKQRLRQVLTRSEQGKRLLHLLPDNPRIPKAYGLPKTHKQGIPLRPIISGVGSAPHRLAKVLAKPLSQLLGKLSGVHLKNSSDLLQRLENVGFRNKVLASFDVKSLFTNVPNEGAMEALEEALDSAEDKELPLPQADFISAVSLCTNFGSLEFNGEEFRQHSGLAMGSPLSPVLACLYMESLEKRHYLKIVGEHSTWLRYVDDVFLVTNQRNNLDEMLEKLNSVNPKIQFTLEREKDQKLAFLDTLVHRDNHGARFSVYRKPTNKDDFIHFFSSHTHRVKTGTVIGFYLRAYRICSDEFLDSEIEFVTTAFKRLAYPESLLIRSKEVAKTIISKSRHQKEDKLRRVTLPSCQGMDKISKTLEKHGISVVNPTGTTIRDLVRTQSPRNTCTRDNKGVIYRIPCSTCTSSYIGETGRSLQLRIREHQRDVASDNTSNALAQHALKTGHYPNWTSAQKLRTAMERVQRKALEAAYIQTEPDALNTSAGFYIWAQAAAKIALDKPAT